MANLTEDQQVEWVRQALDPTPDPRTRIPLEERLAAAAARGDKLVEVFDVEVPFYVDVFSWAPLPGPVSPVFDNTHNTIHRATAPIVRDVANGARYIDLGRVELRLGADVDFVRLS